MKYLIIVGFLSAFSVGFHRVSEINKIKEEAEKAFRNNDFEKSSTLYLLLLNQYSVKEESIHINLAHSFFKKGERKNAEQQYLLLTHSTDKRMKATAFQQLGVLMGMRGKNQEAIDYFIQSLKMDPFNEKARYNYEMIKKIQDLQLEEEHSQKADKNNKNKETKEKGGSSRGTNKMETEIRKANEGDDQVDRGKANEGDIREESNSGEERTGKNPDQNENNSRDQKMNEFGDKSKKAKRVRRLAQVNLSEEKAKMILEAMKNEEVQYLQQVRKNIPAKDYKNKPDW